MRCPCENMYPCFLILELKPPVSFIGIQWLSIFKSWRPLKNIYHYSTDFSYIFALFPKWSWFGWILLFYFTRLDGKLNIQTILKSWLLFPKSVRFWVNATILEDYFRTGLVFFGWDIHSISCFFMYVLSFECLSMNVLCICIWACLVFWVYEYVCVVHMHMCWCECASVSMYVCVCILYEFLIWSTFLKSRYK